MAITEPARQHLYRRLEEVLGPEGAETLMEHLPTTGWSDVATRSDVRASAAELRGELAEAKAELRGDMADLKAELRGDMADMKAELRGEMADMKAELRGEMAGLRLDMAQLGERLAREQRNQFTAFAALSTSLAGLVVVLQQVL